MNTPVRYLHFDNINMKDPEVSSRCSCCGKEFKSTQVPRERLEEVLRRVKAEFDTHDCNLAQGVTPRLSGAAPSR